MTTDQFILLLQNLIWPAFFIIIYIINYESFRKIIKAIVLRIEDGAEVEFSNIKIGQVPNSLPSPKENEKITENHLALLHSSWRYPKKDPEFKAEMYVIQVILQANEDVLDKVEYVKYSLHSSYPNKYQVKTDRLNKFELKELAWGEFNLKAEVKIKQQQDPINLTRYINLIKSGDNLLKD